MQHLDDSLDDFELRSITLDELNKVVHASGSGPALGG
jgi:hypothetical protein